MDPSGVQPKVRFRGITNKHHGETVPQLLNTGHKEVGTMDLKATAPQVMNVETSTPQRRNITRVGGQHGRKARTV